MGSLQSLASTYSNIGIIYNDKKEYAKAMEYYTKALKMDEELGNQNEMAINYMNMGILYYDQKNFSKALECYQRALAICEATGNKNYIAAGKANIGSVYSDMGKMAEAEKYLLEALALDKEIESLDDERQVQELLSKMYERSGREKPALQAYKSAALLKDSIFNLEKDKEITRKEMNFEFERKEALARAEQDKKDALAGEEEAKQRIITYSIVGVLLLVLVFSFSLFNRFRVIKKQKNVIEEQKLMVDAAYEKLHEKNKEVLDSIHYAHRIQKALITSEHYIAKHIRRLIEN